MNTCNQCGEEMEARINSEKMYISVCTNPKCPNYGLLQVSQGEMWKYEKDEKEKD